MFNLKRLFFNLWYYRKPPWDTGISPPELMEFIESNKPGRALDLGCGTGTNCITLAENNWNVIGVDFSRRAIQSARRKVERKELKVEFRIGDVTRLESLQGKFDLILDIGCFHSLGPNEKVSYIQNTNNYLEGGGTFLLYGWIKESTAKGSGIYDADLMRLSKCLRLIDRKDGTERGTLPSAWFTYQK